jgi:hypothetical protein
MIQTCFSIRLFRAFNLVPQLSCRSSSSSSSTLLLRARDHPSFATRFRISEGEARECFFDWAKRHDALSFSLGDEPQLRSVLTPMWSFEARGSSSQHNVYAGQSFDGSAAEACAKFRSHGELALYTDEHRQVPGSQERAEEDPMALGVGAAFDIAMAEHSLLTHSSLNAARLVYMPQFCVVYHHLRIPLAAWVCGSTGQTYGISHLAGWEHFTAPGSNFAANSEFLQRIGEGAATGAANAVGRYARTGSSVGVRNMFEGASRVGATALTSVLTFARAHPKVGSCLSTCALSVPILRWGVV